MFPYCLVFATFSPFAEAFHPLETPRGRCGIGCMASALGRGLERVRIGEGTATPDMALGLLLVKGNLEWVKNRLRETGNDQTRFHAEMEGLTRICDLGFYEICSVLRRSRSKRDRIFSKLLGLSFQGSCAKNLEKSALEVSPGHFESTGKCSEIANYLLKGTPDDSDYCIMELAEKHCNVSGYCRFQETNNLENNGYKTSHRLLYLQMADKLGCKVYDEKDSRLARRRLCESMLKEAEGIYDKNVYTARDLFLEHIALCGYEGYLEFAKEKWIEMIISWQSVDGCFGLLPPELELRKTCPKGGIGYVRRVRDDSIFDSVCHTHITAVSVSAIAFHLRAAVNELISQKRKFSHQDPHRKSSPATIFSSRPLNSRQLPFF